LTQAAAKLGRTKKKINNKQTKGGTVISLLRRNTKCTAAQTSPLHPKETTLKTLVTKKRKG